jgi:hypothetical protein
LQIAGVARIEAGLVIATHGSDRTTINDMISGYARLRLALARTPEIPALLSFLPRPDGKLVLFRVEPKD